MENEIQKENETQENVEEVSQEAQLDKKIQELKDLTELNSKTLQDIKVEKALSGSADAGQEPEAPKEETPEQYKNRVMSGSLE